MKKLFLVFPIIALMAASCNSSEETPIQNKPAPQSSNQQQPTVPNSTKPQTTKGEAADWQIYTNQKYNFQISYPKDWVLEKNDDDGSYYLLPKSFQDNQRDNAIVINTENVGRETVFQSNSGVDITNSTFAGKSVKSYILETKSSYSASYHFVTHPIGWQDWNEINVDVTQEHSEMIPLFKNVIATFKLTK